MRTQPRLAIVSVLCLALLRPSAAVAGEKAGRDPLAKYFTGKTVTELQVSRAWLRANLGEKVARLDFGKFVGAPDGSKVTVEQYGNNGVVIWTMHPWYQGGGAPQAQIRDLFRQKDGSFRMVGRGFCLAANAPKGLGTRVHARQVLEARKLGVTTMTTKAARNGGYTMNGYYTWPRLGYDAPLEKGQRAGLPRALASAKTLNQLMSLPGGPAWWKHNGTDVQVEFDLDPMSSSSRVLASYLAEKGMRVGE